MTPENLEKELHLTHAQLMRFFRLREDGWGIAGEPLRRLSDAVPKVHRAFLEQAFKESLTLLLDPEKDIIGALIRREELEEAFHRCDRLIDQEPGFAALSPLEREASRLQRGGLSLAALEGAGLGTFGVGTPETAILTALMLRSLFETAVLYGVNISHPWEKELTLLILSAAFSSGEEARVQRGRLFTALNSLAQGKTTEIDREKSIDCAAKRMAGSMSLQKFIQGIPLVGISGMFFNTAAVTRLDALSRTVYKERYLSAKLRASHASIHKEE